MLRSSGLNSDKVPLGKQRARCFERTQELLISFSLKEMRSFELMLLKLF